MRKSVVFLKLYTDHYLLDCAAMSFQRSFFTFILLIVALSWASAQEAQQITVRPGDTLWDLARRHDTSVDSLRAANALVGDDLRPGMVLSLPTGADATPARYTVKIGDTLYDISVAFDISVDDLIAFNDLDGTVIRPGQVLTLATPEVQPPPLTVTVAPGDTLWAIARENDVTVDELVAANGISTGTILRPGDVLSVPGRYAGTQQDQGGAAAPVVTVAPGESLWLLARRYDTSVSALMAANGLRTTAIRAGTRLKIVPGSDLVRALPDVSGEEDRGIITWPLNGGITSRFGYRRLRIGGTNMHYGIDIDGHVGDPIRSATAGVVTYSGWQGGYGNLVIVQTGNTEYYYAHANALLVNVGDRVQAGQQLATVGTTGRVTGSHLHFEIRVDGSPVDPLPRLRALTQN